MLEEDGAEGGILPQAAPAHPQHAAADPGLRRFDVRRITRRDPLERFPVLSAFDAPLRARRSACLLSMDCGSAATMQR
jgi:hypothetical protein